MPRDAVGKMTARIVSQRVAPRPKAASRSFGGTEANASREMAVTVGSTMIASTSAAGSIPGPLSRVPKNGIQPRCSIQPVGNGANGGNDDEDAPQAVDHAGDGRQQLDDVLQHDVDLRRQEVLGQEDGHGQPKAEPMATPRIEL